MGEFLNCGGAAVPEQFPAGLRVLVVDDDVPCLRILEQMLRRCMYQVTTCSQATVALQYLRERKDCYDVVLSDVHMPDMDGFKLLELVGLEMDLPVIMMSADGRTNLVLRGIKHGACDYLIKPIRQEQLKNIWQHVVRKKWTGTKDQEQSGSVDDNNGTTHEIGEAENASSGNEGIDGLVKTRKKKRGAKEEEEDEVENDDPASSKKPRVVWSVELHQQFVSAVNQLGIDKAVPKRILELMNVPGLTRENVASHLQKFRLYLKRLSGVAQQHGVTPNSFYGPIEQNPKVGPYGRFDIQAMVASGQIPPQTLMAMQNELLGRPTGNMVLPAMDQQTLQVPMQGGKFISMDNGVGYGRNLFKGPSQCIISPEETHFGYGAWPSANLGAIGSCDNLGGLGVQNGSTSTGILQHQRHQESQCRIPEHGRAVNVQPSCLVVPSHSSASFLSGNVSLSVDQIRNFNRSSVMDYSLLAPQLNSSSFSFEQLPNGGTRADVLSGYSGPGTVSPSISCRSLDAENCSGHQGQSSIPTFSGGRQLPGVVNNMGDTHGSYSSSGQLLDEGTLRNLGFVGKVTSIPSRIAVFESEPEPQPVTSLNHGVNGESNGRVVKQEPSIDSAGDAKLTINMKENFSSNDLTSVFSE